MTTMMSSTSTTAPITKYHVQFVDPGMLPKDYANLSEKGVAAALVNERKARDYTRVFVKVDGRVVQVFQREVGCDNWFAHRADGPLVHLCAP